MPYTLKTRESSRKTRTLSVYSLCIDFLLRARQDLNLRPTGPEPVALSTEPRALDLKIVLS